MTKVHVYTQTVYEIRTTDWCIVLCDLEFAKLQLNIVFETLQTVYWETLILGGEGKEVVFYSIFPAFQKKEVEGRIILYIMAW